jgi:arylsulfatase A
MPVRPAATLFLVLPFLARNIGFADGAAAPDAPRPNIMVVLADDLGYGDLGCYGHPIIQSPHLDRFARQGLRLTDCYAAAANCSPARTGLMTGRTPYRVGIHNWIPMFSPMHVRPEEITIATILRNHGYATCHVGKWHLNGRFNLPEQPQPSDHGFDHWFSTQNNALPNHHNPDNFVRNGKPVGKLQGYSAQLVAAEAVHWLRELRDARRPFFLFVCFHEPHEPIATDPRFVAHYADWDDPARVAHYGNVTQMDAAFGTLTRALDDLGLSENTFVFFTSDNGPAITRRHPYGSSGPLREKKGHLYEAGIRVPGMIRWPGHTQPGTTSDRPICGVDLLPTLCALAGAAVPGDRAIDGASFLPLLGGQPITRNTPLYWQYNRASSKPKVAVRIGNWKLLAHLTGPELKPGADLVPGEMQAIKTAELATFELYDLENDIGESTDVAAAEPERVQQMAAEMRRLYRAVRDESPTWPAWQWPRYEAQRIVW